MENQPGSQACCCVAQFINISVTLGNTEQPEKRLQFSEIRTRHDKNWTAISSSALCANGMTQFSPGGRTEIKDKRRGGSGRGGGRWKDNTMDGLL